MIQERPTVCLELESTPETLTLVRGALGAVAELLSLDPELLDDVKTAVSEACNNVVLHAYGDEVGPLSVRMYISATALEVVVRDKGVGIAPQAVHDENLQGVGLPVIQALVSRHEIRRPSDGGTEVWMEFPAQREGRALFAAPTAAAPLDGWLDRMSGDAVVSLSPVSFVGAVLGRLTRALAARARFSLDRFSDVYLVTDSVAAHAARAASGDRIGFSVATSTRKIELMIGPFVAGTGALLRSTRPVQDVTSALLLLSDEVRAEPANGVEMLRIVMSDRRAPTAPTG